VFGTASPAAEPPSEEVSGSVVKAAAGRHRTLAVGGAVAALALVGAAVALRPDSAERTSAPASTATTALADSVGTAATGGPTDAGANVALPRGLTGTVAAPTADGALLTVNLADGSQRVTPVPAELDDRWRTWAIGDGLVAVAADGELAAAALGPDGHPSGFVPIGRADRLVGATDSRWIVAMEMDASDAALTAITARDGGVLWTTVTLPPGAEVAGVAADRLVVTGGGNISLYDPDTGLSVPVTTGQLLAASATRIARIVCDDAVTCTLRDGPWDNPDERVRSLPDALRGIWGPGSPRTLSPDGRYVAGIDTGWNDQQVRILDLANGVVRTAPSGGWRGPLTQAAFTPDSRYVIHLSDPRGDGPATLVATPVEAGTDLDVAVIGSPEEG
jgi:hypothetical protein